MKKIIPLLLFSIMFLISRTNGQHEKINSQYVEAIVKKIKDTIGYYYVDKNIGIQVGTYIEDQYRNGEYAISQDLDSLSKLITRDLRVLTDDLHLYVSHKPIGQKTEYSEEYLESKGRRSNFGIVKIEISSENIALVKIEHFSIWQHIASATSSISAMVDFIKNADAVVFDVRDNPGGVPYLVAFLISHFMEKENVKLANYYHRYDNSWHPLYTSSIDIASKMTEQPIFIWVNERTASAAEEFAYWMKHQNRAKIVGDTTAGAGYGAMWHRLNDDLILSVSSEEDINPITQSNFEKVGVVPDYVIDDKEALQKVFELAQKAANKKKIEIRESQLKWKKELLKLSSLNSQDSIHSILEYGLRIGSLDEDEINRMGYDYLYTRKDPKRAEIIFLKNVLSYPTSPNVHDSYSESLFLNGKKELAHEYITNAVVLARLQNDPNLLLFENNLEKIKNDK